MTLLQSQIDELVIREPADLGIMADMYSEIDDVRESFVRWIIGCEEWPSADNWAARFFQDGKDNPENRAIRHLLHLWLKHRVFLWDEARRFLAAELLDKLSES